jgi:hypothetical protein
MAGYGDKVTEALPRAVRPRLPRRNVPSTLSYASRGTIFLKVGAKVASLPCCIRVTMARLTAPLLHLGGAASALNSPWTVRDRMQRKQNI